MPATREEAHEFLYKEGEVLRRRVLGDAHVDRGTAKGITDFARAAQELATEAGWGTIWTRPGLALAQRSTVVVAVLATMGKQAELAGHVKGALNNGLTEAELKEIFLQVMVYTGLPNGLEAFRTADAAITQWKAEHPAAAGQ